MFGSTVQLRMRKSEDLSDTLAAMLNNISYEEIFQEIIDLSLALEES